MLEQEGQPPASNPKADAKAAKAYAKALRPWYKKKRWIASLGLVVLIVIGVAASGGEEEGTKAAGTDAGADQAPAADQAPKKPADSEPAAEEEPEMTSAQENALEAAQNYLDLTGFSKAGLIQQLSSSAGDGYSKADATFAANNVGADWNEEAVEAAQNYLDVTAFSKAGLIQQLSSSAGDKFTPAQARYAADKVY